MKTPHYSLAKHKNRRVRYLLLGGGFADTLEHTILRPLPVLCGVSLSLLVFFVISFVVFSYAYQIENLIILSYTYLFGYLVGCIYEYIRFMLKISPNS
jgi:hypothetical protein